MQIEISKTSCFNFHELTLQTEVVKMTDGKDVETHKIDCHAQPDTEGKQVTLECQLDVAGPAMVRVIIQAIHTSSGKMLSSLKIETPAISVLVSKKRVRPIEMEEHKDSEPKLHAPPRKSQKLSVDYTIEDLLQFDLLPSLGFDLITTDISNNLFDLTYDANAIDLFL